MGLSFGLFENDSFSIICFRKYRPGKCAYYIVIGLVHGFRPKGAIFPFFFFGNIGKENVFSDILEWKNKFLCNKNIKLVFFTLDKRENVFYEILERINNFIRYKNKTFEKSKNWDFSKRVSLLLWSKTGHFPTFFFFWQYRQGKCIFWYSRVKKQVSMQ